MATVIGRAAFVGCLLFFCGCDLQRTMLYHPDRYMPPAAALAAQGLHYWPAGPGDYRGIVSTLPAGQAQGTIVLFHGNAGTAADRIFYVEPLVRLGFRVLLAEYPGYGGRSGELGEGPFVSDAKETLRRAFEAYGGPMYLLGESLGCGVAAAAAKDSFVAIDGIILITPWDSLLSVAREKFPWLPVRLLLRDTYDTVENLKGYRGKIVIVGAERDEVIPIAHAEALARSLPASGTMLIIKGAGHNDWPDRVNSAWWKEITDTVQGKKQ